jgi:hypothetical protein
MAFHVPEKYRVRIGQMRSDESFGNCGAFWIPQRVGAPIRVIASDGEGWEHVSDSLDSRCPNWQEMCRIKGLFWDAEDCVMQLHPPESQYVNNHPFCLHLWRPVDVQIPQPPSILVGYVGISAQTAAGSRR